MTLETLEERRLLTLEMRWGNWPMMGEFPEVSEWSDFTISSSTGPQATGGLNVDFNAMQLHIENAAGQTVQLSATGTATIGEDYELVVWWNTGGSYASQRFSSGSISFAVPSDVTLVYLLPDPIRDHAFEGNEHADIAIQDTPNYDVQSGAFSNRVAIKEPAYVGTTLLCECTCTCAALSTSTESGGSRGVKAQHNSVGNVQFVYGEPALMIAGNLVEPPLAPTSLVPSSVDITLDFSGGDQVRTNVPFLDGYEAYSTTPGIFVIPTTSMTTGSYGFTAYFSEFYDSLGVIPEGDLHFYQNKGDATNYFLYIDWGAWWFGRGWGIKNLNSLRVEGDVATLREGDGMQRFFRKSTVSGSNEWIPLDGASGKFTLTTGDGGSTYQVRESSGTVQHFSVVGATSWYKLTQRVDGAGNATTYGYQNRNDAVSNAFGGIRPTSITEPDGRVASLIYTGNYLSSVSYSTAGTALSTTLGVDSVTGELDSILDPVPVSGRVQPTTNFFYEAGGPWGYRLTQMQEKDDRGTTATGDDNWRTTNWHYNANGELDLVTRPDGSTRSFVYDDAAQGSLARWEPYPSVRVKDELGREERSILDWTGNPLVHRDAEGNLSYTLRNLGGYILASYDHDPDADGPLSAPLTTQTYSFAHVLTSRTAPDGGVKRFTYDATYNRMTSQIDEVGRAVYNDIDSANGNVRYHQEVVGTKDALTNYNGTNATVDGISDDRVTVFSFTASGSGLPLGLVTQERDALGRLTKYEYYKSGVTGYNVANYGKLYRVYLPEVSGESAGSVYRQFTYDTNGNLSVVRDELGRNTNYTYDALGRLVQIQYVDPYPGEGSSTGPTELWTFDSLGRVTNYTDKGGRETKYTYNILTLTKQLEVIVQEPPREVGGASLISKAYYDALGNLVKSIDPLGRETNQSFDALNRLMQIEQPDPDSGGALKSPLTTFAYDRMGRQVAQIQATDLRSMNAATGFWTNMAPAMEALFETDISATTAVPRTEIDLSAMFKDDQDSDSALSYSIQSVGGSSSYFDAVSISTTSPRKLVIEYTGTVNFMDAPIVVRATDTSGLTKDVTLLVDRTQATSDEFKVNTSTTGSQLKPQLGAKPDGGFVVVWEDTETWVIRAQQYDKNGSTWNSEFDISQVANATTPNVTVAPDGRMLFTYWRSLSGASKDLYRRWFNANGSPAESEVLLASIGASETATLMRASVAFLSNGEYVVAWQETVSGVHDIKAARYNASNVLQGSAFTVNSTTLGNQQLPSVTATNDGGFVVAWWGNGSGDTNGSYARRYLADGTALGSEKLVNQSTSGSQSAVVLANGAFAFAWWGSGTDAQTGTTDSVGVFARLMGADGTPLSGEILVNQTTTNWQDTPEIASTPDGGFVVAWKGDVGANGTEIYTRRFLANGLAAGNEQLMNTTNSGAQTAAAVTVTTLGAVVASWSGNGTGDTSGIMARFASPYDPSNALSGPFRVLSVSPAETIVGPVQKLLVTFSGPVDFSTVVAADFTVVGPSGSVGINTPQLISATQIILPLTNPQSTVGTYTVTVSPSISRTSGSGGGEIDQNLDGAPGSASLDKAQFAFYVTGGESEPSFVNAGAHPIANITLGSTDSTTPSTSLDLSTQFKDAQQVSTELMYSIVGITGDAQFRSAEISSGDGSTLVLKYATGLSGSKTSNVTVRATDATGRYVEDTFSVTRPTPLAGSTASPSKFQVLAVSPYQIATGPVDRYVVTFNDSVQDNGTNLSSTNFVLKDPNNATAGLAGGTPITLLGKNQVMVRLGSFTTLLGGYTLEISGDVKNASGVKLNQDEDASAGEGTDDKFVTKFYLAPGPRSRTAYDATSRPVKMVDPLGNVTQSVYDLAGQLRAMIDPLGRKSINRYNDLGLLKSAAQPYPEGGIDRDYDDGESGGSGSWATTGGTWQAGPSGFETDSKYFVATSGGTATATWTLNSLTAGKTYEVLVTWPADATNNASNSPFTVFDNTTALETVRVNQKVAPETHPTLAGAWQTLGYYTPGTTTLKVQLKSDADATKRVVADAVRLVEVSADRYSYDKVGNLEFVTDARGSKTKHVYDARNRQTEEWGTDPAGTGAESSSQKTAFQYDTIGQLLKVTDQVGRETGYVYDDLGRKKQIKQANPATGLISSGALITDYRYDYSGTLNYVEQPDLGTPYGRPKTEYFYDQHDNLKEVRYPDPDGTDSVYTTRPTIKYTYDDVGRRRSEVDPLGNMRWNTYDDLNRLTKVEETPADAAFDDPDSAPSGWTRITSNSPGYNADHSRSVSTTQQVISTSVTGLTVGKKYRVLATWHEDTSANTTDAQYLFKDGATTEFTVEVNQRLLPSDYFAENRGWKSLGVFTADNTTGALEIRRIATDGEAIADGLRIVEITESTTQFEFDSRGNLLRTVDPLGRVTQTVYDALDRPRSTIDALGFRDFASYDAAGQLTQQVDQLGRATVNAYDPLGRVKSVTLPDPDAAGTILAAPQWLYGYDAVGNQVSMTDPRNNVTTFEYDRLNRLTKTLEPAVGGIQPDSRYEYYADGRVRRQRDAESAWTEFVYDGLGRLKERWDPNASTGQSNDGGNPLQAVGPVTAYGFDALSRKTSETLPDPDGAGGPLLAPVTTWTYDNLGRLLKLQQPDPDGAASLGRPTTQYVYDAAGNLTSVTTPNPADTDGSAEAAITTSFAYDYLNRRSSATRNDPDTTGPLTAQVTAYGYDLVGNLIKVTEPDPDGSSNPLQSPVTWHYFDALNREIATLDPREGMTRYAFDAVGNRLSLTDPVLNTTTWTYDRLNRPIADINALGDARRSVYDAAGNETRAIDRLGRVRQFVYDNLNRRTDEKWYATVTLADAAGTPDRAFAWTFDLVDQTKAANDPAANYSYNYDKQGNVLLATSDLNGLASTKNVFLEQTYDHLGRRLDSKASIGTNKDDTKDYLNSYSFDALNRLTTITQDDRPTGTYNQVAEKNVAFVYNALGQAQKLTRYSNVAGSTQVAYTDYAYDMFARLTSISHKKPSGPSDVLDQFAYTFDSLNRVTGVDFTTQVAGANYDAEDVTTYAYDATDQLTTTDRTTGTDESFVHDLNGNRRMSGTTNWVVGANNQLTGDGTYTYQYDKEGNRTKRTKTSDASYVDYAFDSRNRLTQAKSKNSGGTVTQQVDYVYDAFDRLTKRTFDADGAGAGAAVDEYFVYDGNDVALRFDGAGSLTKRYLNGQATDQILAEEQLSAGLASNDRVYWALTDNLGTVRDVINQVAARKNHLTYDAFGKITTESDTAIDFLYGFTGLLRDEATGFYLTQTRWLDPATGKWVQEDWIGFAGGDANLARYVGNSATNATDPTGLAAIPVPPPGEASPALPPLGNTPPPGLEYPPPPILPDPIPPFGGFDDGTPTFPPLPPIEPGTSMSNMNVGEFPCCFEVPEVVLAISFREDSKTEVAGWYNGLFADYEVTIDANAPDWKAAAAELDAEVPDHVVAMVIFSGHGWDGSIGKFEPGEAGRFDSNNITSAGSPQHEFLSVLKKKLRSSSPFGFSSRIELKSCRSANGEVGEAFIRTISQETGAFVVGYDDWYAITPHGNAKVANPDTGTVCEFRDYGPYAGSKAEWLNGQYGKKAAKKRDKKD